MSRLAPSPSQWPAHGGAFNPPRHRHAVPDQSRVALCGRLVNPNASADLPQCPECVKLAGQKSWVSR